MAEEKVTAAADYRKKNVKTKLVTTPGKSVFKIRPISPLDYVNERIPLAKKGDDEVVAGRQFVKAILLNCVLEPKLVEKKTSENELTLDELSFPDYHFLVKEITNYSTSSNTDFLATGQNS